MLQLRYLTHKTQKSSSGGFPLLRLRSTSASVALASLACSSLMLAGCEQPREDWRSVESAHHVAYYEDCTPQSDEQRERTRVSILVLEKFPANSEMYRSAALGFMKSDNDRCHDEDIDRKAAKLFVDSGFFPRWSSVKNAESVGKAWVLAGLK